MTGTATDKRKRKGPKPSDGVGRKAMTMIRSTQRWKDWLQRFAKHCRLDVSDTADQAFVRYAYERGFEPPPPR